jgi:hypothetical protein
LQFGRSGPQQVKLDSVEAIELAEVVTIGNVIGNSAGETGGYHHAVDGAQATLRTVRVERVTARQIFAREYNPPKVRRFSRSKWRGVYRITGRYNRGSVPITRLHP